MKIDGRLDEPAWFAAKSIGRFHFPWHTSGRREQSIVKLLWDDKNLYLATLCQDAHITARYTEHDGPIPEDDCIEIMIAPDPARPKFYFNVEWNVLGGYIDGHRPQGGEGARQPWDADGVQIAGTHAGTLNDDSDSDRWWLAEVAIPMSNFSISIATAAKRTCNTVNGRRPIRRNHLSMSHIGSERSSSRRNRYPSALGVPEGNAIPNRIWRNQGEYFRMRGPSIPAVVACTRRRSRFRSANGPTKNAGIVRKD
jgi:hypothetical protein